MTSTIIPAQPGWYLLFPSMYGGGADFEDTDLEAVIAWRIDTETNGAGDQSHMVTAIYAGGGAETAWMVGPNGNVNDGHTYTFPDVAAAITHIRREKEGGET